MPKRQTNDRHRATPQTRGQKALPKVEVVRPLNVGTVLEGIRLIPSHAVGGVRRTRVMLSLTTRNGPHGGAAQGRGGPL